ncbi:MAG: hypothetical protein HKO62_01550 [Gammaproteobacteria bacterium]|nr:hypothetical protein [Gammaproteobacteria bacterium]
MILTTRNAAAALLLLSITLPARAVPLQDLFNGASLVAGDKLFDNWFLVLTDASNPGLLPDLTAIDVVPLADGGNDPGPGLRFDLGGELTLAQGATPNPFIELFFSYRVASLGNAFIKDNSLFFQSGLVTLAGDNGSVVEEFVGSAVGLGDLATKTIELSYLDGQGLTEQLSDQAVFAPRSDIFVQTGIQVYIDDLGPNPPSGDIVGVTSFEQRFSQIELTEPAPLALVALGLIGLGLARRR